MPVVSVSDPRLASKVGTRTWGTRLRVARVRGRTDGAREGKHEATGKATRKQRSCDLFSRDVQVPIILISVESHLPQLQGRP